jgi:hypothetical protein
MLDMAVLAGEIAAIVSEEVERAVSPLLARIATLEGLDPMERAMPALTSLVKEQVANMAPRFDAAQAKQLVDDAVAALPPAKDGESVDPEQVRAMVDDAVAALPVPKDGESVDPEAVRAMVEEAVAALPPAQDGESIDPEAVRSMVAEHVDVAVAALPVPKDGESVDPEQVRAMVDDAVAALPAPKDGESVDIEQVRSMVTDQVERAVAALPAPKDGENADMDAAFVRIGEEVARAVAALPVAKDGNDGAGIADLLIDRDGALIATFTDGRTKNLGPVVGTDGKPGETFELDDFDIVPLDDGRTFKFCFTRGAAMHSFEFAFPVILDRGVYVAERQYVEGDAVTWGGSIWIAQRATDTKPDSPESGWRLAVKRGRDGKDAR